MPILQFSPLPSAPSPAFFHALTKHKLDVARLDDGVVPITAEYTEGKLVRDRESADGDAEVGIPGGLEVGGSAFDGLTGTASGSSTRVTGLLKNFNTIEEFKDSDKQALFQSVLNKMTTSLSTPNPILSPFLLLTFADLKKYKYYYWFAVPAVVQKPAWEVETEGEWPRAPAEEIASIRAAIPEFRAAHLEDSTGAYIVVTSPAGRISLAPLSSYSQTTFVSEPPTIAFHDPSTLSSNPGWPLRNILLYLATTHSCARVRVVCLREGGREASRVGVAHLPIGGEASTTTDLGKGVGWEKNEKGKLGPRMVDLGPTMDPARLADQAVDLNLKLMRWRILPSLDLDRIASTKCLLLGAGTLGCYVSRVLMGWGVRNITFVDSSTVSFSNPVRQPLFEFADSLDGGKAKAPAAAEALRRIFPGVNAAGHVLSIPMPGHPVPPASVAQAQAAVTQLEALIEEHDVVFLLMDSRESRWLPTLLGASLGKIVISAALGFDSYLVLRHGEGIPKEQSPSLSPDAPAPTPTRRLACYFCQDSNALGNSLNDRTLDQMCTVSRPGLAAIASASAVELLVSLLSHPAGIAAPADLPPKAGLDDQRQATTASPLGMVPHQLRGALATFQTLNLSGEAFSLCTACGPAVVEAYRAEGWQMLERAFKEPEYLARLTGLEALNRETEEVMEGLDWDEEE